MIRTAGQTVLSNNGVLTDVTYYGEQKLAYDIRKTGINFGTVSSPMPCHNNGVPN